MKRHLVQSAYSSVSPADYVERAIRCRWVVKAICGKIWLPTENESTTKKLCKGCKNELKRQIADRLALL